MANSTPRETTLDVSVSSSCDAFDLDSFSSANFCRIEKWFEFQDNHRREMDASDLANQVLHQLSDHIQQHLSDGWNDESIERMLWRIAVCRWKDELRKLNRAKRGKHRKAMAKKLSIDVVEISANDGKLEEVDRNDDIECVSLELTARQGEIMKLQLDNHTQSEIATKLAVNESTVKREILKIRKVADPILSVTSTLNPQPRSEK